MNNKSQLHNKSISHSSRFDSVNVDTSALERGIKKFPLADSKVKNISELIKEKSTVDKIPKFSSQRKAEY